MENNLENIEDKRIDRVSKEEYMGLKFKLKISQEQNKKKIKVASWFGGVILSIVLSILFIFMTYENSNETTAFSIIIPIIVASIFGIVFGVVFALYYNLIFEEQLNGIRGKIFEYEVEHIQDEVQEDVFENSIKMSYKYLDSYYSQTREQAQKGFYITVIISTFGSLLIAVGIIAMFFERTKPSYVTCASGVITEFISAIFFYLYNKTVVSMSKYHNKLVLSQNISIALKVADTLPSDDKVKSKNLIISELLKDINTYLIKSDSKDNKKPKSE